MNQLSLRNNRLKFKTSEELPIILEESVEYASNEWKQNQKMSTCNRLDLESLGSWPNTYAHKLPGHWLALTGSTYRFYFSLNDRDPTWDTKLTWLIWNKTTDLLTAWRRYFIRSAQKIVCMSSLKRVQKTNIMLYQDCDYKNNVITQKSKHSWMLI